MLADSMAVTLDDLTVDVWVGVLVETWADWSVVEWDKQWVAWKADYLVEMSANSTASTQVDSKVGLSVDLSAELWGALLAYLTVMMKESLMVGQSDTRLLGEQLDVSGSRWEKTTVRWLELPMGSR